MKIKHLEIRNFRAIENLVIDNLENLVLIIGQNGVGKSCIFDAIRLFKSSYGAYTSNEINQWFSEFQPNTSNENRLIPFFKDKSLPLSIKATFELAAGEIEYLKQNYENLIIKLVSNQVSFRSNPPILANNPETYTSDAREYSFQAERLIKEGVSSFETQILQTEFAGSIEFYSDNLRYDIQENIILEILFNNFLLDQLGIIDFHGPHRFYQRESISNLNINLTDISEQYKGNALYNYSNKYNNIKNELASSYVKALLYDENGKTAFENLNYSLKCLFEHFLPGKEYIGLDKDNPNVLNFLVRLSTGETHDINELSSGEKEIIFGYLRLRNQAAKNSIILIDEPELHLNPKLSRKLPEFYHNTIGKEYNNQIWLVTHSESILKESLNHDEFSIYHLSEPQNGKNQAIEISKSKEIESVLIDLIGFNLNNKVVVVEGENSEFDKKMITKLFPEIEKSINIISAGRKTNVIAVHDVLNTAYENNIIDKKFYSIVDKDNGEVINNINEKKFSWDVYHIENYLLDEEYH